MARQHHPLLVLVAVLVLVALVQLLLAPLLEPLLYLLPNNRLGSVAVVAIL
jgi:hypothetical protein